MAPQLPIPINPQPATHTFPSFPPHTTHTHTHTGPTSCFVGAAQRLPAPEAEGEAAQKCALREVNTPVGGWRKEARPCKQSRYTSRDFSCPPPPLLRAFVVPNNQRISVHGKRIWVHFYTPLYASFTHPFSSPPPPLAHTQAQAPCEGTARAPEAPGASPASQGVIVTTPGDMPPTTSSLRRGGTMGGGTGGGRRARVRLVGAEAVGRSAAAVGAVSGWTREAGTRRDMSGIRTTTIIIRLRTGTTTTNQRRRRTVTGGAATSSSRARRRRGETVGTGTRRGGRREEGTAIAAARSGGPPGRKGTGGLDETTTRREKRNERRKTPPWSWTRKTCG